MSVTVISVMTVMTGNGKVGTIKITEMAVMVVKGPVEGRSTKR